MIEHRTRAEIIAERDTGALRTRRWRLLGIWASGLVASALLGGIFTQWLLGRYMVSTGMVAGAAIFACVRLWLGERRPTV